MCVPGVVPVSLNSRRSMDKRWITHHRNVTHGFMISQVKIARISQGVPFWDPETGEIAGDGLTVLWEGRARLQDNKDWRARDVLTASDPQMVQFIRVQIPLREDGPVPHFEVDDYVLVQPPDPQSTWTHDLDLQSWTLRLRNSLNSSYPWLRNLLCSVDVSEDTFVPGTNTGSGLPSDSGPFPGGG